MKSNEINKLVRHLVPTKLPNGTPEPERRKQLEEDIRAQLTSLRLDIRNRVVLLGDIEDAGDQFCAVVQTKPISGVLMHACSLATLNFGMLKEMNTVVGRLLEWGTILLVILLIFAIRLIHEYWVRKHKKWDYKSIEILACSTLALATFFIFKWNIRVFLIYWPDFLWVSLGLFLHPFLTEPFYRASMSLLKGSYHFVQDFATRRPGGKHDR